MRKNHLLLSASVVSLLGLAPLPSFATSGFVPYVNDYAKNSVVFVSQEAVETKAKDFISKLTSDGIGVIESELTDDQRKAEFRKLLTNNFDMKTIGRFALGRFWKTSSKQQQTEYLDLFKDMIVRVYSKRFNDYNGQKIIVNGSRLAGESDAIVSSDIVPSSGPKIAVEWRVRQKKDGTLKVVDIIVEGVSMSLTQRSDFASVIQRGGGDVEVLLDHLRKS
ncbi:MAG: ABC transporter substrate-binding protein [Alphaproteobacteria bacterium]|nr:ABC transporter substrate-binding protein [Alphaproteobacteria bacterium]